MGLQNGSASLENSFAVFYEISHVLYSTTSSPTLGIYSSEMKTPQKNLL
jgi:hypothetical protein